jgi:hypothetical protein
MNCRTVSVLTLGICLLLLAPTYPGKGNDAVAGSADEGLIDGGVSTPIAATTLCGSTVPSPAGSSQSCLPRYGEPEEILTLYPPTDLWGMRSADWNDDGWPDVVLWRGLYQTEQAFELDVLLNDGEGNLVLGTSEVFSGTVPSVVGVGAPVLADYNGDGRPDMLFPDAGMDAHPFPGHQNTLVLSAPGGKMVDATDHLPQQSDYTYPAAAADIDGDEDVDLYIGNLDSQTRIPPQVWLNVDGTGVFTVTAGRLPLPLQNYDNGSYTASEFVDVNNDTFPDLVPGDGGCGWPGDGPDSLVLLNDGTGHFSYLDNAIPAKPFDKTDLATQIDADDINGDGYRDLFIVYTKAYQGQGDENLTGRYIQILINNQDGTFRDETSARLPQSDNDDSWILWFDLLDLDMDGYLDIVAAPMIGDLLFHLNNGDGTYTPLANVFNTPTNVFTFLDIDQDGFLDVLWSWGGVPDEVHYLVRALGCPMFLPLVCCNDIVEPHSQSIMSLEGTLKRSDSVLHQAGEERFHEGKAGDPTCGQVGRTLW